jgi:hypothetical protein
MVKRISSWFAIIAVLGLIGLSMALSGNLRGAKRMVIEVKNTDDLGNLTSSYLGLAEGNVDATLEVHLAPGVYGRASFGPMNFMLEHPDRAKAAKIDIVLKAASPDHPAIFQDMPSSIKAKNLHLENIVITGRQRAGVLKVGVAQSFTAKNLMIADNNMTDSYGAALVEMTALSTNPITVKLENSWFVRNNKAESGTLLAFAGGGAYLKEVLFNSVAFLANDLLTDVSFTGIQNVKIQNAFILKRNVSTEAQVFASFYNQPQTFTLEKSLVVTNQLEQMATFNNTPQTTLLNNSVFLTSESIPANVTWLQNTKSRVERANWLETRTAEVEAFVKTIQPNKIPKVSSVLEQFRTRFGIKP